MIIKALAPWFGSKRMLAPKIIEQLGDHSSFWDPFCGSMAVLLGKRRSTMETVNDLHGDLINLARVIQDKRSCMKLYRRLRRVLCCEELMRQARDEVQEKRFKPGVKRAYWYFIQSWLGRNGTAGGKGCHQHYCRRFTPRGGSPGMRLVSVVQSIPQWRRRLGGVQILRMDAFEMIERIEDNDRAAIYIDPPYFQQGGRYEHSFEPADHHRLAELLNRFERARVVLSYYEHPKLAELYPGWGRIEIPVRKFLGNAAAREKKGGKAMEVLLVNGPVYEVEGEQLGLFNKNAHVGIADPEAEA